MENSHRQKVIVGKPREEVVYAQMYCDHCGQRITDYDKSGKCTAEGCKKVLCERCIRMVGEKGYCPEHVPKKGICFIATAVFGSPLSPELSYFRNFREILLKHDIGKSAVKVYYLTSPLLANLIIKSKRLRAVCRITFVIPALLLVKRFLKNRNFNGTF